MLIRMMFMLAFWDVYYIFRETPVYSSGFTAKQFREKELHSRQFRDKELSSRSSLLAHICNMSVL